MSRPLADRLWGRATGNIAPQSFEWHFGFAADLRFSGCLWKRIEFENGHIGFSDMELQVAVSPRLYLTEDITGRKTENRARGETATPAAPIVHETDSPTEYLTVHYQNGNYEWFEFNFRVRNGVAYLGSKMRITRPQNGRGWIPPEVKDAIHKHHPDLEVSPHPPPWWP